MTKPTRHHRIGRHAPSLGGFIAVFVLALLTPKIHAQTDVEFNFGQREVWVGQPFNITIDVVNAESHTPPDVPEIAGASSELLPGNRTSSFMQVVNGVVTKRETISYTLRITPDRSGIIEIPSISVEADGRLFESDPWRLIASRSEVGDLLFVEVLADPTEAWIGEPIDLTLQIWVKQYRDLEERIALDEANMWSLLDQSASRWGIFTETITQLQRERRRPAGREIDRDGQRYFLYELSAVEYPIRAGRVDSGDVRVVLRQPTGVRAERDLFGRRDLSIEGVRPVVATAEDASVEVRELPEEGRPALFTGAVGRFRIRAMAEPRDVSVGDPITLILEVEDVGDGPAVDLANLRPPDLRAATDLAGFRIPDSPTTGVVEGRTKIFTETLRPERDDLTEIPAIAFPSFDPDLGRYVIARTVPVPILVSPSERLDLDLALRGGELDGGSRGRSLTTVNDALRANQPVDAIDLDGGGPWRPTWSMAVPLTLPPFAYAAFSVASWRRRHRRDHPELVRAGRARAEALGRLAKTEDPVADRVVRCLSELVASRLHLPHGALTARETIDQARHAGTSPELLASLERVLKRAEAARYDRGHGDGDESLLEDARSLVDELARLRPASKGGAA